MPDRFVVAVEPIARLRADGIEDLFAQHWEEVALNKDTIPLAVDWEGYSRDERGGILKAISIRSDDQIVGYAWFYVSPHRHYLSTIFAVNDILYVDPEWRPRGAGIRLIRETEKILRDLGVVVVHYHTKDHVLSDRGGLEKLLTALEYDKIGAILGKRLR